MKKLIVLLCLLTIPILGYAESYILIDSATKEVKSLSPQDDAQLIEGWEKIIIPDEYKDIELQYAPRYYKYQDERFVVNIQKLSDEALAQEEQEEIAEEAEMISLKAKELAIIELKKEGKKINHHEDTGELKKK